MSLQKIKIEPPIPITRNFTDPPGHKGSRKIVFICSRYGGQEKYLEAARQYCEMAVKMGYIPLAPHLLFPQFVDENSEEGRAEAIKWGVSIATKICHEMWIFYASGISDGMQYELDNIPKFIPKRYFLDWANKTVEEVDVGEFEEIVETGKSYGFGEG